MAFIVLPGADASGNGNDWTPNNINSTDTSSTTYDIMTDVPTLTDEDTANYATLNPLSSYWNATYGSGTDGNLQTSTYNQGDAWTTSLGTVPLPSSGKYYWEVTAQANIHCIVGILATNLYNTVGTATYMGGASFPKGKGYYGANGLMWENGATSTFGATYTAGDVIGVRADMDTRTMYWYKNNVLQGSRTLDAGVEYAPATSRYSFSYNTWNFGQRPFAYTPPTGYLKLNTFNLPDSSIVDGSEYFVTAVYTGNGAARSIDNTITSSGGVKTGDPIQFSPGLVWLKTRNVALYHLLTDSVRGVTHTLSSNTTDNEAFSTEDVLTSFDSNGFSLTADDGAGYFGWNVSGQTMAAWNWKAGGTAVSNTDGDIASSVSANTTAGFSVVTYTGNGGTGTVGHGLGAAPTMVIIKNRSQADGWYVYHKYNGAGAFGYLFLNSNDVTRSSTPQFGSTVPSNSVISLTRNTYDWANASSENYVAYCFCRCRRIQ